jgi:hypothetical protein
MQAKSGHRVVFGTELHWKSGSTGIEPSYFTGIHPESNPVREDGLIGCCVRFGLRMGRSVRANVLCKSLVGAINLPCLPVEINLPVPSLPDTQCSAVSTESLQVAYG